MFSFVCWRELKSGVPKGGHLQGGGTRDDEISQLSFQCNSRQGKCRLDRHFEMWGVQDVGVWGFAKTV